MPVILYSKWTWTGEMNSRRIRERYLKGVLRQDIAYFDTLGAGEVATRIQSDTGMSSIRWLLKVLKPFTNIDLIQTGISEKVALVAQYSSSFFAGFISQSRHSIPQNLRLLRLQSCICPIVASCPRFNLHCPLYCALWERYGENRRQTQKVRQRVLFLRQPANERVEANVNLTFVCQSESDTYCQWRLIRRRGHFHDPNRPRKPKRISDIIDTPY